MEDRTLSDSEIVAALRGDDNDKRREALDALYPDGQGASLVTIGVSTAQVANTSTLDAGRMFNVMLLVTQGLGRHLGLKLDWVPDPKESDRIEIAREVGRSYFQ